MLLFLKPTESDKMDGGFINPFAQRYVKFDDFLRACLVPVKMPIALAQTGSRSYFHVRTRAIKGFNIKKRPQSAISRNGVCSVSQS